MSALLLPFDPTIRLSDLLSALGIIVSAAIFAATYWFTKNQDRDEANRQIYQQLELASVRLFQNEITYPNLALLWEHSSRQLHTLAPDLPLDFFESYILQQLNLLEMAYSFRKQHLMPAEVFGSWVEWFGKLCESPFFRECWTRKDAEAPLNYVPEFREILYEGCMIYAEQELALDKKRKKFFSYVGDKIKCPLVCQWLEADSAARGSKMKHRPSR